MAIRVSPGFRPTKRTQPQPPQAMDMIMTYEQMVNVYTQLEALRANFQEKIQEVDTKLKDASEMLQTATQELQRASEIQRGETGEKGDQGEKGDFYTPQRGIDFFDGNDGRDGIDGGKGDQGEPGYSPILGKDFLTPKELKQIKAEILASIPTPKDGKDAKIDHDKIVDHVHKKLRGNLTVKDIQGLDQTISAFSNQLGRGYMHGGGDTIKAGTGVTITTNSDGTKTVTAASSANVATERLTGTQSGSDVTLNLTALAHTFSTILWVSRQGQILTPTDDWTRVGNTITITGADAASVFLVHYSY